MLPDDNPAVLFLDVDGVISHPAALQAGLPADVACVAHLNRITDETAARIVVSSSWRKGGLGQIAYLLRKWGVTGRVVGITPDLSVSRIYGVYAGEERGREIQAWLSKYPGFGRFVILDDGRDMGHLVHRLVRTDPTRGLTEADATCAIGMLRGHYG